MNGAEKEPDEELESGYPSAEEVLRETLYILQGTDVGLDFALMWAHHYLDGYLNSEEKDE